MPRRKTLNVQDFKDWTNKQLVSAWLTPMHKRGLSDSLEHVLQATGNYKGFGYVYADDVRPCLPDETGAAAVNPAWTIAHEYRRMYH